jgi:hypothetical protein
MRRAIIVMVAMTYMIFTGAHASWFHIEGPEVSCEPYRDHGDGPRQCSQSIDEPRGGDTFPQHPLV